MNLKFLRKALDNARKKIGVSLNAVEILIYANHCDTFDVSNIRLDVSSSERSFRESLKRLSELGLIRIVKERNQYRTRVYSITGKGKLEVNKFYKSLKTLEYYDGNWKAQIQI
jgi:predicted transcriptional regulator